MPVILDQSGIIFEQYTYESEQEFERDVIKHAAQIFGPSSIYIDVKKKVKGNNVVTIPDGYVIDLADPKDPKLFVVENEIVEHDPFRHIGIQMLKFVTSFEDAQKAVRDFLMEEINRDSGKLAILEASAKQAGARNIDAYLDQAVYSEFRGIVIIDEAREELHQVIRRINANISVLEFKAYKAENDGRLLEFDTLYDEFEESTVMRDTQRPSMNLEAREQRRARRAKADTVIVPAREEGFKEVFLGQNQWRAIRISAAMKDKIKHIAAYQVAPISAVTYIAEVKEIKPYKDTGKYVLVFQGPAEKIGPIQLRESKNKPQSSVYVRREKLLAAKFLEDAFL